MNKKGYSIKIFEKDDLIYRNAPPIEMGFNENLGMDIEISGKVDFLIGRPLKFICIENDMIYVRDLDKNLDRQKPDGIIRSFPMLTHEMDWMPFTIPEGMDIQDCY